MYGGSNVCFRLVSQHVQLVNLEGSWNLLQMKYKEVIFNLHYVHPETIIGFS